MEKTERTTNESNQPELMSQFVTAHQDAEEKLLLRYDLNKLWEDNHLTKNDRIKLHTCSSQEGAMHIAMVRNGDIYNPNPKLVKQLGWIADTYTFDELEAWPCCCFGKCSNILFSRRLGELVLDVIADEYGQIADLPTTGVTRGDGDDEDYVEDDDD
jgi:hypothetical protein